MHLIEQSTDAAVDGKRHADLADEMALHTAASITNDAIAADTESGSADLDVASGASGNLLSVDTNAQSSSAVVPGFSPSHDPALSADASGERARDDVAGDDNFASSENSFGADVSSEARHRQSEAGALIVYTAPTDTPDDGLRERFHRKRIAICKRAFQRSETACRKMRDAVFDSLEEVITYVTHPDFDLKTHCALIGRRFTRATLKNLPLAVIEPLSGIDRKLASKQGQAVTFALRITGRDAVKASAFLRQHGIEKCARWCGQLEGGRAVGALTSPTNADPEVPLQVFGVPPLLEGIVVIKIEIAGGEGRFVSLERGPLPLLEFSNGRIIDVQPEEDQAAAGGQAGPATPEREAPAA